MKKPLALFVYLLVTVTLFSQKTNSTNTLLWRISGKGLTQPSYLFGTMHLTDKSVFYFGDSLYKAMEQVQGFAAELDMNRIGMQMLNKSVSDAEAKAATEPIKVKDAVSAEMWELYKGALKEKFGKPAEKITLDDLEEIETSLQHDLMKKGEMQTFLDAYLFGMARKMGKWVGGLEELQDQVEHMNADDVEDKIQMALFDDDYYRNGIEWMKKIYNAQQLDSIDAMMYRSEKGGKKDYIMIKRNLKMAHGMDSLSGIRSTFFAVGAAHLPGDSGVIALLRSQGFNVTPVISSKKINPDKYVVKSVNVPWVKVPVRDQAYNLEMPGLAEGFEYFESMGLEMKLYLDISYMKLFMTLNAELPEERRKLGKDSIYMAMRRQYESKGKVTMDKAINVAGIDGREVRISGDEGEFRIQVFIPTLERVILNGLFTFNEKNLTDDEAKRFFQSFAYDMNFKRPVAEKKAWALEQFPQHAFAIEMPIRPKEKKDVNSYEGKIGYEYQHIDIKEQVVYGVSLYTVKEGNYQTVDTSYYIKVAEEMRAGFVDPVVSDSIYFNINGYPAFQYAVTGKKGDQIFESNIMAVVRGNRIYYLYTLFAPTDENRKSAKRFLKSFTLLPYAQRAWTRVSAPGGYFSTLSPQPLRKTETGEEDKLPQVERFIVYDTVVALSAYVDRIPVPNWYSLESDTAFLRKRSLHFKNWNDTITNYTVKEDGKMKIAAFNVEKPGSQLVRKIKLILNGDELYELYTHLAEKDFTANYDRFFNEFKVNSERRKLPTEKNMVKALRNVVDTATYFGIHEINLWWSYIDFTATDIPLLQEMSMKLYPDADSNYSSPFNDALIAKLHELDTLHTTINYIRDHYAAIGKKDEHVKPYLLSYLSTVQTKESYDVLKGILNGPLLDIDHPLTFSSQFYDSIELTARLFPAIGRYAGTKSLGGYSLSITTWLIDSNLIGKKDVLPFADGFINATRDALSKETGSSVGNEYQYHDHITMLATLNTPEAVTLLNRIAKFDNRGLRFKTLVAQMKNGLPYNSKTIYTLAGTDEYRHDLYDELKKLGKLKLFPNQFLSQMELGKSKLFTYASDEDMPEMIDYIGEKKMLYKGRQQKFYLYKVRYQSESYFGVAGPFSLDGKDYVSSHDATGFYWREEYDSSKKDEHFKAYMTELEGDDDEEAIEPPPPPPALPPGVNISPRKN